MRAQHCFLIALFVGLLTVRCGGPALTAPSMLDLTGTWEGQTLMTRCETNWIDIRSCAHPQEPFTTRLVVAQHGGTVLGRFVRVFSSIAVSGEVSGRTLTLRGHLDTGRDQEFIDNWITDVSGESVALGIQGTFDHRHIQDGICASGGYNCVDPVVWRRTYRVTDMKRVE
jgi:hypothetical protein